MKVFITLLAGLIIGSIGESLVANTTQPLIISLPYIAFVSFFSLGTLMVLRVIKKLTTKMSNTNPGAYYFGDFVFKGR